MVVERDVQKRILKAILSNGGVAKCEDIVRLSNLRYPSVVVGCKHLVSRALIVKKVEKIKAKYRIPPHRINTFKLNDNLMPKIKRLISEIGQND